MSSMRIPPSPGGRAPDIEKEHKQPDEAMHGYGADSNSSRGDTHATATAYDDDDDDNDDDDFSGTDVYTALKHVEAAAAMDSASIITGQLASFHATYHADATDTVHEMHLALLYLLSNPDEFSKALQLAPPRGATTLQEWNAEYDNESLITETESLPPTGANVGRTSSQHQHRSTNSAANGNTTITTPSSSSFQPVLPVSTKSSNSSPTTTATATTTPLPFVVFADDAEVVLPQAHTASQLFGVERIEGIELEAAAGIAAISQLFLRWLALMPGGDHLNIIDPPGLTVMRIAGGRYRVTAAHRVVWTWMNEFAALTDPFTAAAHSAATATAATAASKRRHFKQRQHHHDTEGNYDDDDDDDDNDEEDDDIVGATTMPINSNDATVNFLHVGDLVSMTIVDVFETDNRGKLLSYCPTFDNRAITKTHATTETIRKSSHQLLTLLGRAQKSKTASSLVKQARSVTHILRQKVDAAVQNISQHGIQQQHGPSTSNVSNSRRTMSASDDSDVGKTGMDHVRGIVQQAENLFLHRVQSPFGSNNNNNNSLPPPSRASAVIPMATLSHTETEDGTVSTNGRADSYSYTAGSTVPGVDDPSYAAPHTSHFTTATHYSAVTSTSSYLGDDDSERHEV